MYQIVTGLSFPKTLSHNNGLQKILTQFKFPLCCYLQPYTAEKSSQCNLQLRKAYLLQLYSLEKNKNHSRHTV